MNRCKVDLERRRAAAEDSTIAERVGRFERRISMNPGYDHRSFPDECGGGGHGQHGMDLRFVLIGEEGAVQWLAYLTALVPEWLAYLTALVPGRADDNFGTVRIEHPKVGAAMAADLGYHWPTPRYEGQEKYGRDNCDLLSGDKCFYDGSGLNAQPVLIRFLAEGPHGVWDSLESYYDELKSGPVS